MYKKKKAFNRRVQFIAGLALSLIMLMVYMLAPEAGIGMTTAALMVWGSVKDGTFKELSIEEIEKLPKEDQSKYFADRAEYHKSELDKALKLLDDKIKQAEKGAVGTDDYEKFKTSIQEKLNGLTLTEKTKTELHEKHAELIEKLKLQGAEIKALKETSTGLGEKDKKKFELMSRTSQFKYLLDKGMETEEFKNWMNSDMRGATQKMDVLKVTGLATGHTGDIFITEAVDNIRDIPRTQPTMRDFISVSTTDETDITYPEVKDFNDIYTLGTQMLAENEAITDVSFASDEKTSKVVRMGVSMDVSKRYFRGKSSSIINHIIAQIPDALRYKENIQILKGDGSGNNLNGIITDARTFNLTPATYVATNFASVATWNSGTQTLVTFNAAHGLLGGDNLTIANAAEATYNATHNEILIVDEKSLIINLTYVVEADTSAWTGTGTSYWYQLKEEANEFDVVSAAISILEAGLYRANVVFLNNQTVMNISTLKADDLQYIGVTRDSMGNLNISGVPIVSMPGIDAGWFLLGDFSAKNIEIKDYTTMSIQFLEDITTKKTNSIVILADEEMHLVKYNPKWYIYDRFSTSKTQLTKPPVV